MAVGGGDMTAGGGATAAALLPVLLNVGWRSMDTGGAADADEDRRRASGGAMPKTTGGEDDKRTPRSAAMEADTPRSPPMDARRLICGWSARTTTEQVGQARQRV